jgi:hypothetical protein
LSELSIRELDTAGALVAAAVLGRGMRDNPLHVAAFGTDPVFRERALEGMFAPVLRQQSAKGPILGAFRGDVLLGVCGMVPPGRCRSSLGAKLGAVPGLLRVAGLGASLRVALWIGRWSSFDPDEPHWHLGPVAVERPLQGKGIGSELLREFCRRVDADGRAAYLETDRPENVRLYERFGFRTVRREPVLGVPSWFMLRAAAVEV